MRPFIALLAGVCTLGACDAGTRTGTATTDTIRVVDHTDRVVQLTAPAQRVLCLMPAVTDMLLAMGAQDRLIARTQWDTAAVIAHLPSTGNALMPSVEWVAAQQPELVIAWPDQPTRSVVSRLIAMGIPVYSAITETVDDALRTAHDMGVLLDLQSAADSVVRSIRDELQSVRESVQDRPPVTVAYVLSVDPLTIAGPVTFVGQLLETAGGQNVFADLRAPWPQVSLEEMVRRNPAALIIPRGQGVGTLARLRDSPGWRELQAVRNGRVLAVEGDLFNRPSPNMPRAARVVAQFLHPDVLP